MELLQTIKLFSIPTWVKVVVALLLATLGLVNTGLFFIGIFTNNHEGWVKASIELLSVILPIFILALVLWKSEAGTDSLRRKTEEFFLGLLPSVLSRLMETDAPFFEPKRKKKLADLHTGAKVYVNVQKNDCYSDVVVFAPDRDKYLEIAIRLEINVRKVNFNLCLDENLILAEYKRRVGVSPVGSDGHKDDLPTWIFRCFKHTMGGAGLKSAHETIEAKVRAGEYQFNSNLLRRVVGGRTMLCVVASCSVAQNFLFDPSERLFFAQDLMFFLRSFLTEEPSLFRSIPASVFPATIKQLTEGHLVSVPTETT